MARNERLRAAIESAGLTIGGLARAMKVDRKTAERWVGGRVPRVSSREQIAQVLKVPVTHLWPEEEEVAPPGAALVPVPEVEGMWPTRAAVPAAMWGELVDLATAQVDIAAYAGVWLFEADPAFADRLTAAAKRGTRVRVAMSHPNSGRALARGKAEGIGSGVRQLAAMTWTYLTAANPAVELLDHDLDLPATIFRADDRLLWAPHHVGLNDRDSPVLSLRLSGGGQIGQNVIRSLDWIMENSTVRHS